MLILTRYSNLKLLPHGYEIIILLYQINFKLQLKLLLFLLIIFILLKTITYLFRVNSKILRCQKILLSTRYDFTIKKRTAIHEIYLP